MLRVANQIASFLRGAQGAEDVKVEQVEGLPFLEIKIDKAEIARLAVARGVTREQYLGTEDVDSDAYAPDDPKHPSYVETMVDMDAVRRLERYNR